jgi:hypothetical protein
MCIRVVAACTEKGIVRAVSRFSAASEMIKEVQKAVGILDKDIEWTGATYGLPYYFPISNWMWRPAACSCSRGSIPRQTGGTRSGGILPKKASFCGSPKGGQRALQHGSVNVCGNAPRW